VADVHVDDVRGGLEVIVPDGGEDLPGVTHKILQQRKLPAGELYLPIFAPGVAREEVYREAVGLYLRRLGLVRAAQHTDLR